MRWARRLKRKFRKRVTLTGRHYEIARRLLLDACDILERANIEHYVHAGTLLGIVRAGDLIPWDKDIDSQVPVAELPRVQAVYPEFRARGRRISDDYPMAVASPAWRAGDLRSIKVRNRNIIYIGRGRICLDLFMLYPGEGFRWWSFGQCICRAPDRHYAGHSEIEFAGRRPRAVLVRVPGADPRARSSLRRQARARCPRPDGVGARTLGRWGASG